MSTSVSTSTATSPDTGSGQPRQSRLQQIGIVAAVVLLIIASGVWLARSQGAATLGDGGVHSSLLPEVGEPAPEFMTLYADGAVFRLSDLQGQPVWLNFWGSWCPPCRAEMPELQAAWEDLEPRGMNMIGVSMREHPQVAVDYRDRVGATFPVAVDPNMLASVASEAGDPVVAQQIQELASTWEIRNYPTHVFINADGIVQAVVFNQLTTECAIEWSELVMGERDAVSRDCRPVT